MRSTAELVDDATSTYDRTLAARVHLVAVGALLAGHPAPTDDADDRLIAALRGIR